MPASSIVDRLRERMPDSIKNVSRPLRRGARQMQIRLRVYDPRSRIEPSFLIIGAMKAGTTSLFRYLCEHPQIAAPAVKEIEYFDFNWARGEAWYRAHFPLKARNGGNVVSGEASPGYLVHPRAAARTAGLLPGARIIVLLRDPVQRAISHYFHERRIGLETRSVDAALRSAEATTPFLIPYGYERAWHRAHYAADNGRRAHPELLQRWPVHLAYVDVGRYADHLPAWFDAFGRSRVLVLSSEQLFAEPLATLNRALAFLNLSLTDRSDLRAHNAGTYSRPVDDATIAYLEQIFREPNQRLYELLGEDLGW